jgi:predicted RNA-binding Zn-ribbon protein involved in translation (DUF1610 family)
MNERWGLCTNRQSRHHLETILCQFTCEQYAGEGTRAEAGVPIDENAIIVTDILCKHCGYNLRTMSVNGKCPECGDEVNESVERDEVVIESATAYGRMGAGGLPAILGALRGANPYLKNAAVYALTQLGEEAAQAIPELMTALRDENADVRWWAAYALGELGAAAQNTMEELSKAAHDADEDVRAAAEAAIGKIAGKTT